MTEPETRPGGVHRRTDSRRLLKLLGSLLVVVIVAGGVVAALHWRGESSKPGPVTAASHTSSFSPPTGTPHASSAPASSAPATTPPPAASTTVSSPTDAPTPTPTPTLKPTPSVSTPAVRLTVDIFNSTHIGGLAASAAKTLSSGGWSVGATGNYPHSITSTTVYYPAGDLASAQLLAHQYTAIREVVAAPSGLSTTDLTLVLTTDWTTDGR
jgi:LytR cell envelope-related transcriptional attenuator